METSMHFFPYIVNSFSSRDYVLFIFTSLIPSNSAWQILGAEECLTKEEE
jgi:hypothetical protein